MERKERNKKIAVLLIMAIIITCFPHMEIWAKKTAKGVVTATELYMRSGPGTDYKNITVGDEKVVLVKDQEVTIKGERDGWYRISTVYAGTEVEGYSLAQYISVTSGTVKEETGKFKEITPTPTPTPSPTPIPAAKGVVTATELYVRKGPGTDYDNVMVKNEKALLVKDQKVSVLGEKDGWYHITAKVNSKKIEGYSLATYITITKGDVIDENNIPDVTKTPEPTKKPADDTDVTPEPTPTAGAGDTEEPQDTPFPEEMVNPLPAGAEKDESGKIVDSEGNELELVTEKITSKYDLKGIVTTKLLNCRKNADIKSNVLCTIPKDTVLTIVNSTTNIQTIDDEEKSVRWYKVIVMIDGEPARGYVLSDYVRLNYSTPYSVTTKYAKQVLVTSAGGTKNVKTSKKAKVKLPKNSTVSIIAEEQMNSGKWFKVKAEYKGETVTGWIPEIRIRFESNAKSVTIGYYVQKEEIPQVTVTDGPSPTITPQPDITPVVTGDDDNNPTPTPTPTVTPPPKEDVENPNAIIKDAAALSVKTEPKYSAAVLFTDNKVPVMVYSGQTVRVIDTAYDSENLWVLIELKFKDKLYQGYINSIYVDVDESVNLSAAIPDSNATVMDFEGSLAAEGFPESYKPFLRELHAQFPNWKFKAYNTGLDWNEAVEKESVVGENLIPNTKSVEWKSLEAGAYSWKDDKFTVFDGSSWVTASKEAISYYMDPRNFLGYDTIFQFEVLNYNPSYQNKHGIDVILKNTAMNGASYVYTDELGIDRSITYTDTFAMAAEYSGVSPLHLASRVKQEVTIGAKAMSNSVSGTVAGLENLYNFYNIGAYHSTEAGGAIANGLRFAKNGSSSESLNTKCLIPWNNRFRSILGGSFYIGNNYINRGQNTIYLQKFNVTPNSTYNHQYMANVEAPYSEGKRVFNAYEDPADIPIVFMIPVYLNMPEEPCPVPAKAYNPNNWLKNLKIYDKSGETLALTPSFSVESDQEYSLIVGYDTDYIKYKATPVSSLATVTGGDYFYPEVGTNRVVISVVAENGNIREYVVNIVREPEPEPTPTPEPTPEVTDIPEPTEIPEVTETPETTDVPPVTDNPESTEIPEITETPANTENPENTGVPEDTGDPVSTDSPETGGAPEDPGAG